MEVIKLNNLEEYVGQLNDALKEGLGISFHNNGGLIARNPPGIVLQDWDIVASFNAWGECPVCHQGGSAEFLGIDGPYLDNLFFVEGDEPKLGYRGRIFMPKRVIGGIRTLPLDRTKVNNWNTEYGPTIGRLERSSEHIHNGQVQAYSFTGLKQLAFG